MHELNPDAQRATFGQELNPESYAVCKADMMIKGQEVKNIKHGNTLSDDQLGADKFDYMLSNPPFGVEWKKVQKSVNDEHEQQGFNGRFGAGLPRVSDGSLLFLLHLISKMRPVHEGGSRIGIILNGSPLFTGGAGSGESEIRRYILETDLSAKQETNERAIHNLEVDLKEANETKSGLDIFKKGLISFVRMYEFLSKIVNYEDKALLTF